MCVAVFAGCSGKIDAQSEYKGQQFTMYITEHVYNLDPAYAYKNESTRSVVGLLFDTLFNLDSNGKVTNSLAKSYKTKTVEGDDGEKEYYMYIEIKDDAKWSDNVPVTADDVVFAWKRLLNPNNSFEAAALLFDIKNAQAYNEALVTKDDLGLFADDKLVTIQFEKEIDYDQFVLNLTSLALAPLREDIVSKNVDWAKKPGIMACSGPFKLSRVGYSVNGEVLYEDINYSIKKTDENNKVVKDKEGNDMYIDAVEIDTFEQQVINSFVIERNMYYYRDAEEGDKLDKSVTPYKIIVDCSLSGEDIKKGYESGSILYVGDIPLSIRGDLKGKATKKESLSTNVCYFNQNALVDNGTEEGFKLFEIPEVRQALSMAIDRKTIAESAVFAQAATGLVPTGVYDTNSAKELFRDKNTNKYNFLTYNEEEAIALLESKGITPSDYTFSITVAAYDEVHLLVAEALAAAWGTEGLGFNVEINKLGTVANNDYHKDVKSVPTDLCDDLYAEKLVVGDFEVVILDLVAPSVDPFSVLAPFAKQFSGQKMDMSDSTSYELSPHITGYDSDEYNTLMDEIFAQKDIAKRSANLHKAEAILMNDMPVAPIMFNQTAYLVNEDILDLNNKVFFFFDKATDYYGTVPFAKMSISDKNYEVYVENCKKFIEENFTAWQSNPNSYFGSSSYKELSFEKFKGENSYFAFLFEDELEEETEAKKPAQTTAKPDTVTTEATTSAKTETTEAPAAE